MDDLKNQLSLINHENDIINFDSFKKTAFYTFEKHSPLKQRYDRANQAPFMNKKNE